MKKLAVGSDHAGFELKEALKKHLEERGIEYIDLGTYGIESVDYPVYAKSVCAAVQGGSFDAGVLCCGTGIGMSMVANKQKGIRAAVVSDEFSCEFTRRHNDANVLCLGARVISIEKAVKLLDIFINTPFEGGRHTVRIEQFEN